MKSEMRSSRWLASASLLLALTAATPAAAFHEDGVASCGGCHVMHDSLDGVPIEQQVSGDLLLGETASEVCLLCHATELGAVMGMDPLVPPPEKGGGNFVFLLEDNINDAEDGLTSPIAGHAAGHSVVAPAYGLFEDPVRPVAPGGTFPSSELGCTSCHDPHGNENFRFLYGVGPVQGDLFTFRYPAPDAEGIELGLGAETVGNHTAYRSGMTEWCANCHDRYHDESSLGGFFEHPSDESLGGEISNRYNIYNGDDDPAGGASGTAYLPEVPFEDPAATTSSTAGPTATGKVACITCHRAHATSSPAAGRWDLRVALLVEDGVVSGSYRIPDPYASPNQGRLCNKCHEPGSEP